VSSISGIVLHKILLKPEEAIEYWPKIKLVFFGPGFSSIYTSIAKFYTKYNKIPSFDDLDISIRDSTLKTNIAALKELEIPEDISLDLAVEALVNEYTQNETLLQLDTFLDNVTMLDSEEIKQELANTLMFLEEKTHTSEQIVLMSDIFLFDEEELGSRVPLGINNTFDAETGGVSLTDLIMIGGYRGSGKSLVGVNIINNQYLQGNVGFVFSIEMRAREVFERSVSALAGVDNTRLRKGQSTEDEVLAVAQTRASMYIDAEDVYTDFIKHRDYTKFEHQLSREKQLKTDNQLIIVDNQRLTLADIDLNLQQFKA